MAVVKTAKSRSVEAESKSATSLGAGPSLPLPVEHELRLEEEAVCVPLRPFMLKRGGIRGEYHREPLRRGRPRRRLSITTSSIHSVMIELSLVAYSKAGCTYAEAWVKESILTVERVVSGWFEADGQMSKAG